MLKIFYNQIKNLIFTITALTVFLNIGITCEETKEDKNLLSTQSNHGRQILLSTKNLKTAEEEIKDLGGRITHKLTSSIFVANLKNEPEEFQHSLKISEDKSIFDETSQVMVNAWKTMIQTINNKEYENQPIYQWNDKGFEYPKNPYNDPQLRKEYELQNSSKKIVGVFPSSNSSYMTQSIAINLLIVNGTASSGKSYIFSNNDQNTVISQTLIGTNFFVNNIPEANISFSYNTKIVKITADPGTNPGDFESMEAPWRDAALTNLGYSKGWLGIDQYTQATIKQQGTIWGYTAFFTPYPLAWFGYASNDGIAGRLVMGPNSPSGSDWGGWGITGVNKIFAHETGHIFGAADEYGSCLKDPSGYFKVPNTNCGTSNNCLMNQNTLQLCQFSRGQLGLPWNQIIHGWEMVQGIGLTSWNNKLVMAYSGINPTNAIYTATSSDGVNWTNNGNIKGWAAVQGIGLTSWNNKLVMAYSGINPTNAIYTATSSDGVNWKDNGNVKGWAAVQGIGLTSWNNKLVMAYSGINPTNAIYTATSSDGVNWTNNGNIKGWAAVQGIGLTSWNNKFVMAYIGINPTNAIYTATSSDGVNWTNNGNIKGWAAVQGIGLTSWNNKLVMAYIGINPTNAIYMATSSDGVNWKDNGNVGNWFATRGLELTLFTKNNQTQIVGGYQNNGFNTFLTGAVFK